jgi:hypothetical protein
VPFDALRESLSPELYQRVVGGGARRFVVNGDNTRVFDDEAGVQYTLPVSLERLAFTPELSCGDLLLLRGDCIHRTQDATTQRIAASIRRQGAGTLVSKARMMRGGPYKRNMMKRAPEPYRLALQCFTDSGKDFLTVGEIIRYVRASSGLTRPERG